VLVWSFIEEFAHASGKRIDSVAPESLAALQRHDWPGNVRELRNLVERAVILAKGRDWWSSRRRALSRTAKSAARSPTSRSGTSGRC
jgi:DNA-binding NtrC family response regulator